MFFKVIIILLVTISSYSCADSIDELKRDCKYCKCLQIGFDEYLDEAQRGMWFPLGSHVLSTELDQMSTLWDRPDSLYKWINLAVIDSRLAMEISRVGYSPIGSTTIEKRLAQIDSIQNDRDCYRFFEYELKRNLNKLYM